MNYIVIALMLGALAYDIKLIRDGKPTISQAYQKVFPTWLDIIVTVVMATGICFTTLDPTIKTLLGVIVGHIIWPNKERYRH